MTRLRVNVFHSPIMPRILHMANEDRRRIRHPKSSEVRGNTLVHSRGFSLDVRVHDLDPTLRHSVLVASRAAKQKLKLFTKFQARRQSKWQASASSGPEASCLGSNGKWQQMAVAIGVNWRVYTWKSVDVLLQDATL